MVEIIDARVPFVAALEDAVVRRGPRLVALADGPAFVGRAENGGGACIDDFSNTPVRVPRRLEDVDRADDVDQSAEPRVGAAGRNL